MIRAILPDRGCDPEGCGHYGAPRGERIHTGVDYAAWPGSVILAPRDGVVLREGYPYANGVGGISSDRPFMLLEIQHGDYRARYLYIEPMLQIGDHVAEGEPIGTVQDLRRRYSRITPHVHVDVERDGKLHPDEWFK